MVSKSLKLTLNRYAYWKYATKNSNLSATPCNCGGQCSGGNCTTTCNTCGGQCSGN